MALLLNQKNAAIKIAIVVGMVIFSIRVEVIADKHLQNCFNQKISFSGTVASDPILKNEQVYGSSWRVAHTSFLLRLNSFACGERSYSAHLPVRVQISESNSTPINLGDLVTGKAKIVKTRELKVAALLIVEQTPYITINQNIFLRIASSIRTGFRKLIPTNEAGALIPGIVLGDTSLQSDWQTFEMRNTGLSHLTAVSGTNFAMIAGFIIWLIGFIRLPITARYLIVSSVLIFYIFLVRPSPSVLRAAIMTGVYLFASVIGEKSKSLAALGLAISALIIFDPFQANDPGFALSVCATLGLITLAPILNEKLASLVRSKLLAQSLSIPISATFFTLPVIVVLSNKFSPFSVIANLLTAVVIAPITVLGFMAAILAALLPAISSFIIWLISPLSSWIVLVANKFSKFPALEFENSKLAIAIFISITTLAFTHYYRQMLAIFIVIAAVAVLDRISWPGNNWQIVSCDVGQGDATVIALPKHEAILIDTGPNPQKIEKCLRQLHIKNIPLLVLTHFHADHVAALDSVLRNHQVKTAWVTNQNIPEYSAQRTLQLLQGTQTRYVSAGEKYQIVGIEIDVVWPTSSITNFTNLPGDGSAANNSSIALVIRSEKFSLFACGDLEPEAQSEVMRRFSMPRIEIFKVCHHGSKFQDWQLFKELKPNVALISAGKGNQYGHPSLDTVNHLSDLGSKVMRTDLSGSISVAPGNKIHTLGKNWWHIRWR